MVTVFTKEGCLKCDAAKEKLQLLSIPYEEKPYEAYTVFHDGWEEDGSVDVLAARSYFGSNNVPIIKDGNKFFDYPGYMKYIKNNSK